MRNELPPLEPDIAEVLEAEKAIVPVSAEDKARALTVLLARAAAGGGGGGGGGGRGPRDGPAPSGGGSADLTSWVRAHPWLTALAAFALGVGSDAALHVSFAREHFARVAQAPPPPPSSDLPSSPPAPPEATTPSAPSPSSRTADSEPRVVERKGARSGAPAAQSGDTLAAERAIVDVARHAVGAGDGVAALESVAVHERQFPSGLLEEEREAIAVKALALLGRTGEARSRAARFFARYPRSLLAPAVERSLSSVPAAPDAGASDDGFF
jgi:hypothetical protein